MTFSVSPGPAHARESWAQARPAPAKLLFTSPGPARDCKLQARTRPGPQNITEARPGPWAVGWPVQDSSLHYIPYDSCSSSRFPFLVILPVICHTAMRILLYASTDPCCWPFLSDSRIRLPVPGLYSGNHFTLAVIFLLVFWNLRVSLSQIFSVNYRLTICVQPISSELLC